MIVMAIRILRLEGLVVLIFTLISYGYLGYSWVLFAVLFMAPDLSMLCYFIGPRSGSTAYNIAHGYIGPLLLAAAALFLNTAAALPPALIWAAHIGMDRMFGFGLKRGVDFWDTHLGMIRIGKRIFH